eukprot:366200-Chlamydomonas_euryale.AAC.12
MTCMGGSLGVQAVQIQSAGRYTWPCAQLAQHILGLIALYVAVAVSLRACWRACHAVGLLPIARQ